MTPRRLRRMLSALLVMACTAMLMPAAVIYEDEFNAATLDSAWQVLSGQGTYSLTGGNLRYFNEGPLSGPAPWVTTSLTLALPFTGTHWQVDTKAVYNLYPLNASGYSSGAQRPQFMVGFDQGSPYSDYADFDRGVDAADYPITIGNSLSAWYVSSLPQVTVYGLLNPDDAVIDNNIADGQYWFRIIRDGGSLTMKYSYDGVNYNTALSTSLANPLGSFNQVLLSGTTWETVGSYTDYDYVRITDTTTPEPTSAAMLGVALLGLLLVRRQVRHRTVARRR